jgi:hypothetical protein
MSNLATRLLSCLWEARPRFPVVADLAAALRIAHLLPEHAGSFVLPSGTVLLLPPGRDHDAVLFDLGGHTLPEALAAGIVRHRIDSIMCGATLTDAQARVIADSANAFLTTLYVSIQTKVYGVDSARGYTSFTTPLTADTLRRWVNAHV